MQMRNEIRMLLRGATPIHLRLRRRLAWVWGATFALGLVGAVGMLLLERHAAGSEIQDYGDAFFWTTAQLLTVSSQMKNPVTTGGRILDIFFEAWAISVVAVLAGSIGTFFTHRHLAEHTKPPGPGDLINRPLPGGPPR